MLWVGVWVLGGLVRVWVGVWVLGFVGRLPAWCV